MPGLSPDNRADLVEVLIMLVFVQPGFNLLFSGCNLSIGVGIPREIKGFGFVLGIIKLFEHQMQ